jgi:hypothetical protein
MRYGERYFCSLLLLICLPGIIYETVKYYDKEFDENIFKYFLVTFSIAYEDIYQN